MLISPEQEALLGRVFETYLTEHHHDDILQLIADTNEETHHPVVVNAMTLFEANMEVGDYFNAYPSDVLAIFDNILHRTAMELSHSAFPKHNGGLRTKEQRMRHTFHARITGLPVCPELTRETIPRSRDVGHFLSVTGTVIRASVPKVLEYERDYMCTKCRHVFTVQADFEQYYAFVSPVACPNPDGCSSYKFSCMSGGSEPAACRDYQEIKIQEQVQRLSVGSIPRSMVVVLEDDLVDSCKSGDDVTVYGVMCQRWKPFYDGTPCDVELVLKANNIEVNNQQTVAALLMKDVQQEFEDFWNNYKHDPIAGRNQILLSLCPQVFGMYVIKLAVAMVLAGGVQRIDSSGTKIRGECHMLLVGDPGTGKSQFLKYAAKIMPRSVLTAGIGSTSAGLTVAAVKDGGDWHLEAGALVLSDGGLCCIDEFNSIKEHDRISIHEAMEQQSISVAKAGMVCKLNTRSTILAATNPKGQYNPNEPLSVNVALASPLLSRFDLVLVLLDTRNAEWDRIISSFILENRGLPVDSSSLWSMERMKAYFSVIKRLQPHVSEEANSILTRYYQLQRRSEGRNAARTTIRMLESLSRLAEAHARLMYRETVTIEDAVMAVSVMECSMQGGALLGNVNALLTSFPADPGQQYQTQCQILLEGLNLPQLLQKEMARLIRIKSNASDASQFDPPTDNCQHQLRNTEINKTHCHDISSNCEGGAMVESGLDWFHSIDPSLSLDDIITSTQENPNRKPNSSWSATPTATIEPNSETEKDIQRNMGSTLNHNRTMISHSKEENRKSKKNENIKEKTSIIKEEIKQSERPKDEQNPKLLGCVFEKVSKNLRDRRLKEMDREEARGHGESIVSADSVSKKVTDVLNMTLDCHSSNTLSSGKNCPSNNLTWDNQSSGKESRFEKRDNRDQTGTKNICAELSEKIADEAETVKDLHEKLSDFIFKPKKMGPLRNHDVNARSDDSAELQTECNPGSRDLHIYTESRISKLKPVSHIDAACPLTATQKNERKKNQSQDRLVGGSRREQVSCVSEVEESVSEDSTCFTSTELDKDVFYFGKKKLAKGKTVVRNNDGQNVCQQQGVRVNAGDKTIIDGFTDTPPFNLNTSINPDPSPSGHTKSTIASSALAKLSRFSFTCKTEPTTRTQTKKERNPPPGVEKVSFKINGAECLRAHSKVMNTSDSHEPSSLTKTTCRVNQTEPSHAAKTLMNNGAVEYESIVNQKKRKSFELGPPPSYVGVSNGPFSGLSLFGSIELSNDVLDIDWDQEVSKKAKV